MIENYNPDVLSCLANLSSDEVFTPPGIVNQMLDLLPDEIWFDPKATFLDPAAKTGIFLREIAKRLMVGLEDEIPDRQECINHIFAKQLFGLGITEITALLSRRSVYCSKSANGKYSVAEGFGDLQGNIRFERIEHTWYDNGRCTYCRANRGEYDRGPLMESHAYQFIHTESPEEIFNMQFDVIVGNPPYQLSDGGYGSSASPIYHLFVEQAMKLNPRYLTMIIPSRWFTGGKGLNAFRKRMLSESHLRNIVDYPKLYDGFPGVKIRGGVSYFLWDRDYEGPCVVQTMWDGDPLGPPMERRLDTYDVFVRRNEAVSILDKVRVYRVDDRPETTLDERVSAAKPFGLRTYYHGASSPEGIKKPVKLYGSQRISWIERSEIPRNTEWVETWKVLLTRVQGTSAAVETMFMSRPIIAGPGEACSETYLVAGRFDSKENAEMYAAYLRTRFVRFLVSLRKATQDSPRRVYGFVPDVPLDREWTDDALYNRYQLSEDEIAFIESIVKPMNNGGRDDE